MELIVTPPEMLSGNEPFTSGGKPIGLNVLDFWSFQRSNIYDMQEEIAEFLVAKALGQDLPYNKNGWTLWDIDYRGKRVEVKETGYFYSWQKDGKISEVRTFGITKAFSSYKDKTSSFERQNDVYVFCLNTGCNREQSNPLELDHWRFWVIPTKVINEKCGDNKRINLNRVKKITGNMEGTKYEDLKVAVDKAIDII